MRLDQIAEGNVKRFGNAIKRGQADILFACLDCYQHPSAHPGFFRQCGLAHIRSMAQASNVLADVLQNGGSLSQIFVHYIAHSVGLGSILRNVGGIVRPPF
ncbi:hypothetical protein BR1R3_24980 [Pseudomonas atacamensis]|nr:hypothetical protein BR1R3_24980 [Pseudomonas atacamensis]